MIQFTVPGKRMVFDRPRFGGHVYDTSQNKYQKRDSAMIAKAAMHSQKPMQGPQVVSLAFYSKPPKKWARYFPTTKPDVDNLIKLVFDALNRVSFGDDAQVVGLKEVWKIYTRGEPCTVVRIREVRENEIERFGLKVG
jgi:Holliday junction resolvase RusA-like endonuclease